MTTFNPTATHRCARCGQWWQSKHACPDQLRRAVPPPRFAQGAPIEVTTTDKLIAERDALRAENAELADVLRRSGFRRCDVPACNCGSWHHRFGLPERMAEIADALADAGHPLSNSNGNRSLNALSELVAERNALRAEVERLQTTISRVAAIAHCGGWVGLNEDQTLVYVRALTMGSMPRGSLNVATAALNEAITAARAAQEGKK